jgi:hypothetical protein
VAAITSAVKKMDRKEWLVQSEDRTGRISGRSGFRAPSSEGGQGVRFDPDERVELRRIDGAALETLHPDSMEWRGVARSDRGRECLRGGDCRRILIFVWPDAVSVLEVDPQILDRLGVQLAQYSLVDLGCDAGPQVQSFGVIATTLDS